MQLELTVGFLVRCSCISAVMGNPGMCRKLWLVHLKSVCSPRETCCKALMDDTLPAECKLPNKIHSTRYHSTVTDIQPPPAAYGIIDHDTVSPAGTVQITGTAVFNTWHIPDSIIQLLRPVGGPNDDHAIVAAGNTVKLNQELRLEPSASIVFACRPFRQNAVYLICRQKLYAKV